jgi:hypothetical protein
LECKPDPRVGFDEFFAIPLQTVCPITTLHFSMFRRHVATRYESTAGHSTFQHSVVPTGLRLLYGTCPRDTSPENPQLCKKTIGFLTRDRPGVTGDKAGRQRWRRRSFARRAGPPQAYHKPPDMSRHAGAGAAAIDAERHGYFADAASRCRDVNRLRARVYVSPAQTAQPKRLAFGPAGPAPHGVVRSPLAGGRSPGRTPVTWGQPRPGKWMAATRK